METSCIDKVITIISSGGQSCVHGRVGSFPSWFSNQHKYRQYCDGLVIILGDVEILQRFLIVLHQTSTAIALSFSQFWYFFLF